MTILVLLAATVAASPGIAKKLIELGWDEPSASWIRSHEAVVDRSPFDGVVMHLLLSRVPPNATSKSLGNNAFGPTAFTSDDVKSEVDALASAKTPKLANSFMRLNVGAGEFDWFDRFASIEANATLTARAVCKAHLRGVFFDTEAYKAKPFLFRAQRDAATKGWGPYSAQAHQRGREVIAALEKGCPGLTVFLTYAYALPYHALHSGQCSKLEDCAQGLLKPFLDGMLERATGTTRFIDGDELAYGLRDESQFQDEARKLRSELPAFSGKPDVFKERFSIALPIFLDYKSKTQEWSETDEGKNYYSAAQLEQAVRGALGATDEFVWVYTQKPRFWTDDGVPTGMPLLYLRALQRAKALQ